LFEIFLQLNYESTETIMKKKMALLGLLGAGGGLLFALESQHRRNKRGTKQDDSNVAGNGRSANDYSANQTESARPGTGASMARENGKAAADEGEHIIDDRGTDQVAAAQILKKIRDDAFEASDEKLALALGRPTEEIQEWTSGSGLIDGDLILKARTLAMQRGFEI
jgi:hypothetical protein